MRWNSVSESPYPPYRRSLHNSPRTSLGHHSQDACSSHCCSSDQRNKWGESLSGNREFIMSKSHIIAIRNHFLAFEESWWSSVPLTFLMTHWFGPASGGCHWREPVCSRNSRAPFSQAPSQAVLSLTDPSIFSLCPTWSVPRISSLLLLCEYLLWDLGTDWRGQEIRESWVPILPVLFWREDCWLTHPKTIFSALFSFSTPWTLCSTEPTFQV